MTRNLHAFHPMYEFPSVYLYEQEGKVVSAHLPRRRPAGVVALWVPPSASDWSGRRGAACRPGTAAAPPGDDGPPPPPAATERAGGGDTHDGLPAHGVSDLTCDLLGHTMCNT